MFRDKLKKKIATYQEGVSIRKQEVEQAKVAMAKDEAELSKLQYEEKILKGLVQRLKGIIWLVFSCKCISAKFNYQQKFSPIGCRTSFGVAYR